MCPLHIFKASAGSGKTSRLTQAYLEQLFRRPQAHRHILAVTFTNKAAGEMKHRILTTLHDLSLWKGGRPAHGRGERALGELCRTTGLDPEQVASAAGNLLQEILNDYSYFSVGTIDSFFQSVIRAFTREIGIQPGYNLEMDGDKVLDLALERLFLEIERDASLEDWLLRFAEEQMESEKSWNFRDALANLGQELFREEFQALFSDPDGGELARENLEAFGKDVQAIRTEAEVRIRDIGQKAVDRASALDRDLADLPNKSRSPAVLFLQAAAGNVPISPVPGRKPAPMKANGRERGGGCRHRRIHPGRPHATLPGPVRTGGDPEIRHPGTPSFLLPGNPGRSPGSDRPLQPGTESVPPVGFQPLSPGHHWKQPGSLCLRTDRKPVPASDAGRIPGHLLFQYENFRPLLDNAWPPGTTAWSSGM
ncbi:MAG: UvrD-helicase domain-containing protein [Bacteroidales bacterium]